MDSLKPAAVVADMVASGMTKTVPGPFELRLGGGLSRFLLRLATSLAIGAPIQSGRPIVGALISRVGSVMIVLLGLQPINGSFARLPLVLLRGSASPGALPVSRRGEFAGNLIGSIVKAALLGIALAIAGQVEPAGGADWVCNEIPLALGNILGGLLIAGIALYVTFGRFAAPLFAVLAPGAE